MCAPASVATGGLAKAGSPSTGACHDLSLADMLALRLLVIAFTCVVVESISASLCWLSAARNNMERVQTLPSPSAVLAAVYLDALDSVNDYMYL